MGIELRRNLFRRATRSYFLAALAVAFSLPVGPGITAGSFAGAPRGISFHPVPASGADLTVSAAISLKEALDEIAPIYEAEHSTHIRLNLGGSGTLQHQIEQGAPVDVFISASPKEMDALESQGLLLPGTRRILARNRIVLIVPAGQSAINNFDDLTKPSVKTIAIGEPQTVPAGKYAREVLIHFGLYDSLRPKLVLAKDVRQVLTYVETGNADAGIVYLTDARTSSKVSVVATAPPDSHSPVLYPAAVIRSSSRPDAAKKFLEFLSGEKAGAVFQKYGFVTAAN